MENDLEKTVERVNSSSPDSSPQVKFSRRWSPREHADHIEQDIIAKDRDSNGDKNIGIIFLLLVMFCAIFLSRYPLLAWLVAVLALLVSVFGFYLYVQKRIEIRALQKKLSQIQTEIQKVPPLKTAVKKDLDTFEVQTEIGHNDAEDAELWYPKPLENQNFYDAIKSHEDDLEYVISLEDATVDILNNYDRYKLYRETHPKEYAVTIKSIMEYGNAASRLMCNVGALGGNMKEKAPDKYTVLKEQVERIEELFLVQFPKGKYLRGVGWLDEDVD